MLRYHLYMIKNIYFELLEAWEDKDYLVKIMEEKNGERTQLYAATLKPGSWCRSDRAYLGDYFIEIWDGDELKETIDVVKHVTSLKVFISFESKSLGDTLAWLPYCLAFKEKHGCDVTVSTFLNELFVDEYPELEFVPRGEVVNGIMAMFELGWYWDDNKEPEVPNTIPLQKAATNTLNLPFVELKPRMAFRPKERPIEEKYIAVSTRSTSQAKHWDHFGSLINMLAERRYKIVDVSLEGADFANLEHIEDRSSENLMNYIHHAEFFIGLGSGSSWLAWALDKHVVMICNFSEDGHEFTGNCTRITDTTICHGCWNKEMFKFDKGNWDWCPEHENTNRQFECHKLIKPETVLDIIIEKGLLK